MLRLVRSSRFDVLLSIAEGLRRARIGSPEADRTIHAALDRNGKPLPYTQDEASARSALPDGFEHRLIAKRAGQVYAACRRAGLLEGRWHPHYGQWGMTYPLALCGAAMQAHAAAAVATGRERRTLSLPVEHEDSPGNDVQDGTAGL